jgi:DNA ligase 4
MKNLQNWKINNNINFASYIERVTTAIDPESKFNSNIILEKLDKILDRIIAISPFSFIDLKRRMEKRYIKLIRINKTLSNIFRRLNNSEAKWMVRTIIKNYNSVRISETLTIYQFHFLLLNFLNFQNSFEIAVKFLNKSIIRCISF